MEIPSSRRLPLSTEELARALGVTRVARVTGLDRTGVEVACAVRPGAHVLQVCNGKGLSFEAAARGALHETAELWAAEHCSPSLLRWGSLAQWRQQGEEAWVSEEQGVGFPEDLQMAWRTGIDLGSDREVLVPAQSVHCLPSGGALLGPFDAGWTSNGMGAHSDPQAALLHALLEATERDQLARALPGAWTRKALRERMIDATSLPAQAPLTASLVSQLEARGFRVFLFDASVEEGEEGAVSLPVAAAFLVDRDEGPVPLAAGYACRMSRDEALLAALLEAAQSRLTDIHGAREDVIPGEQEILIELARACSKVKPTRSAARLPSLRRPAEGVNQVLKALEKAGFPQVVVVELEAPLPTVQVVRVIVPGFLRSELL